MTGVIMAGRTGASFAAELGTMQVNEEIDALNTLGISPMEFLVLPRMIALLLMMPLLCLYADFMGMLGGLMVGVLMMDINPMQYALFTIKTVALSNFWIGIFQGFVFGVLVGHGGLLPRHALRQKRFGRGQGDHHRGGELYCEHCRGHVGHHGFVRYSRSVSSWHE